MVTDPPVPSLGIELVTSPGTVTVIIRGELDLVTASLLSRHLAPALDDRLQRLVFDMAGVDFIDCAALQLIASTIRYLPAGRRPVIRHPSAAVRRMLKLISIAADYE